MTTELLICICFVAVSVLVVACALMFQLGRWWEQWRMRFAIIHKVEAFTDDS